MREGVRTGRIDTVRPEHTPEAMGRPPRKDDHGGEVYVYRRTGQPCLVCGTAVRTTELQGRNLFWCPRCQRAFRSPLASTTVSRPAEDRNGMTARTRRVPAGARARRPAAPAHRSSGSSRSRCSSPSPSLDLARVRPADRADRAAAARQPAAEPAAPAVVRRVRDGDADALASASWTRSPPRTVGGIAILFLLCFIVLVTSFRRSPARRRRRDGGVDADRPARPDPQAGRRPDAPRRLAGRERAALRRRYAVRRRLRRLQPHPRRRRVEIAVVDVSGKGEQAGTRALLLSGAFGGLLGALPPARVPAGRQRLPAPPGLGRGLRHRHTPLRRRGDRRLPGAHGRPPAGRPARPPAPAAGRCTRPRGRCSG